MKNLFTLIITLILTLGVVGSAGAQMADIDSLRTQIAEEVAGTAVAEIVGTLTSMYDLVPKGQNQAQSEPVAVAGTPAPTATAAGMFYGSYGTGYWYPTPTYYSYQAKLISQSKNFMHMPHGTEFNVSWTIKNTGPLEWNTQFYLRYYKGQMALEGKLYMLPYNVAKGDTITITRSFRAEEQPGIYNSYWELIDDDGAVILDNIWVGWQVDDWRQ